MIEETPVTIIRGTTKRLRGFVRQHDRTRDLVAKGDQILFLVKDEDNGTIFKTYQSGTPALTPSGNTYDVVIPDGDFTRDQFSQDDYRYLVVLVEADSGEKYPIARGDLTLKDS